MKTLIFVALEFPDYPDEHSKHPPFCAFRISLDQVEQVSKVIHECLVAEEKQFAQVLVVHADESGFVMPTGRQAIAKFKPDILFSCYSDEARRLYPDYGFCGYYTKQILITASTTSRIIRIEEM